MLAGASPDRTRFGGPVGRAAQDTRGRRSHALGVAPHRGQKGQGARPAQPDCSGLHDPGAIAAQEWMLPKNGCCPRMDAAQEWMLPKNGCCPRMAAAQEWLPPQNGCCPRMDAAQEWMLPKNGCCPRMDAAQEWIQRQGGSRGLPAAVANRACLQTAEIFAAHRPAPNLDRARIAKLALRPPHPCPVV